ncbi:MAG: phosphoribosylaminoimidazolesuccinocarboxamide synthase, partial [Planctomycetia bacterium 21-64-5]
MLLNAAVSLRLLSRQGTCFRLGPLGAALRGNPSIAAMVAHHRMFYADLADPVALLRGQAKTQLSQFWFEQLDVPHHVITCDVETMPLAAADRRQLAGRAMLVRKTQVVPIECVARGYLSGSGWKEYLRQGTICGLTLPAGLRESDRLSDPIFTPATKATSGHDENISFEAVCGAVGAELAGELRRRTLEVYRRGADYAVERGIIIADTKFEWGLATEPAGEHRLILIDEVFTPDSSRFWPAEQYRPGRGQASFDKQFVRDWLESVGWDKQS